jgi:osmotically inducible lipoprotein OsmB
MTVKKVFVSCLLMAAIALFSGCTSSMTHTQKGAVGGAAVGAIAGQLIGGNTKSTLIGAGVGALGGALMNDALNDKKKQTQ